MLNLTREELEDIWENKPYGYFTNLRKTAKNLKKYEITAVAYMRKDFKPISRIVYSTNENTAEISIEKSRMRNELVKLYGDNNTNLQINFTVRRY